LQARVDEFVARVQEKAAAYQGDDIMLPMGSDFMYQDAHRWCTSFSAHVAALLLTQATPTGTATSIV
jgi:hypothetical protein